MYNGKSMQVEVTRAKLVGPGPTRPAPGYATAHHAHQWNIDPSNAAVGHNINMTALPAN